MSIQDREIIKIDSREAVWSALDRILHHNLDPAQIVFDFSNSDWASLHVIYKGEIFHQSLTPSVMQGIVEFQNSLYRSIAIILKDDSRISKLTDAEKEEFELNFKVTEGSSDIFAAAGDIVKSLAEKAGEKMSGREITICILAALVLWFGSDGLNKYLSHNLEAKKIEAQSEKDKNIQEILKDINDNNRANQQIIIDALKETNKIAEINREAINGYSALVRNADRAEAVIIQETVVPKEAIENLTQKSRRTGKNIVLKSAFRIVTVDTTDPTGFVVKLEEVGKDRIITAKLSDAVALERFRRIVQKAEWSKTVINVHIVGKQFGDEIRDAQIVKVASIRGPRKTS